MDRLLLIFALLVFVLTVLYIVKGRLFPTAGPVLVPAKGVSISGIQTWWSALIGAVPDEAAPQAPLAEPLPRDEL